MGRTFIIGKIIVILILISAVNVDAAVNCNKKEYILYRLEYSENEGLKHLSDEVYHGCYSGPHIGGDYSLKIAKNGAEKYSTSFNPGVRFVDVGDGEKIAGGEEKIERITFYISTPNIAESTTQVYDQENNLILSIKNQERSAVKESPKREERGLFDWVDGLTNNIMAIIKNIGIP